MARKLKKGKLRTMSFKALINTLIEKSCHLEVELHMKSTISSQTEVIDSCEDPISEHKIDLGNEHRLCGICFLLAGSQMNTVYMFLG